MDKIQELKEKIKKYRIAYEEGHPLISDAEYDLLEEELKLTDPGNEILKEVGNPESPGSIPHKPPMLSLAKSYEINKIKEFMSVSQCIAMEKVDGMAISLEYQKGSLYRAMTRGNGKIGEDVTLFTFHIADIMKNIPSDHNIMIRGEVFFRRSHFKNFEDEFDSPRNAVAGTFSRKEKNIKVLEALSFTPYDIFMKEEDNIISAESFADIFNLSKPIFTQRLSLLKSWGFQTLRYEMIMDDALEPWVEAFFLESRDYLVDGIVFRYDDDVLWEQKGFTAHHPRGSLAYKRNSLQQETVIRDIHSHVNRSGKISFRAEVDEVSVEGAKIKFASLHNISFIEEGGYGLGAKVLIQRSGEVIPALVSCITPPLEKYIPPKVCPCGYLLERKGPDLFCVQQEMCTPKKHEFLIYYCHALECKGLSDKILKKMMDAHLISDPADLYDLQKTDLATLPGLGEKSAENMIKAIDKIRTVTLAQFIYSLGLEGCGYSRSEELASLCKTWEQTLALIEDLDENKWVSLKGWGEKSFDNLKRSLNQKSSMIQRLLLKVKIKEAEEISLDKINVVVTGSLSISRKEWEDHWKTKVKVESSVTQKTQYVICNDKETGSSKLAAAQKKGIPIITELEFQEIMSK